MSLLVLHNLAMRKSRLTLQAMRIGNVFRDLQATLRRRNVFLTLQGPRGQRVILGLQGRIILRLQVLEMKMVLLSLHALRMVGREVLLPEQLRLRERLHARKSLRQV